MLYNTFDQDKEYLLNKFRNPVFEENTGLDLEVIKQNILKINEKMEGYSHKIIKAKAFEYICRNVRIDVNKHDWYVGFACWNRYDRPVAPLLNKWKDEIFANQIKTNDLYNHLRESGAVAMWPDFEHSVPDWDVLFKLGFPGILERAENFKREKEELGTLTSDENAYFEGIDISYKAILEMLQRFYDYAVEQADCQSRVMAVAKSLKTLIEGPPESTYDVLHFIYLYFIFCEHIDHMQVRSMGNLDRTLYPYFKRDLESGTYTEKQLREFIDYFLMQFASINNYWGHPFYLGGTKVNGETEINELSHIIIEEFFKLNITSPKIQLKVNDNTPVDFLEKAYKMIREKNTGFVFVSEKSIKRAMTGLGYSEEEARTCDINGCYEYDVRAKEVKTIPIYLNFLKPVELVLNNGTEPMSGLRCGCRSGEIEEFNAFEDFYQAYIKQLDSILHDAFKCADDFEKYLHEINPASIFSATIENSLRLAKDAFSHGSIYNNSVVLCTGLATAADALVNVKDMVYDKKVLTLRQLKDALDKNWEGYEKIRLRIQNHGKSFGNGCEDADLLVKSIAEHISAKINKRPNARGGFYKAGMHSARTFITLGKLTGATPDGRKAGEEMSKNISPTMGKDINGVTALLNSVSEIDSAMFPADYALDIMLHPLSVQGKGGLTAMQALVKSYMHRGGASVQFNVFDADVLREAQRKPELYANLQVRVCGWSVRFVDLCKEEQELYILRAQNIAV